jgi:hypothetical protein
MTTERTPDDATAIDESIRSFYKLTTESTYSFLVRRANEANTPMDFVGRMRMVTGWLRPRLTSRTRPMYDEIIALLDAIRAYVRVSSNRVWHPPLTVRVSKTAAKAEREARYTAKRDRIMLLFEQADSTHRLAPHLAAQESLRQAQSARASKPRKFDEDKAKRAAKAYHDIKEGRAAYGGVKELAREYGVSEATIRAAAKRYPPNSIDK